MPMLKCRPMEDSLTLAAWAPPEVLAPALAPSTAQTLQGLVLPLEELLAHSSLLTSVPELGSSVLRSRPPPERHPALPEIPRASASSHPGTCQSAAASGPTRLLWSRPSPDPTGIPQVELQAVPSPLQGVISGIDHPHGSSSLLQPSHQLLPERGRPKWQVKPQS